MQTDVKTNGIFQILKGTGLALALSFLGVIILASILRVTPLSDGVIYPVNQTLKVISTALGALLFVRGEKGFIKGGIIGALFTALSYLSFSAIGGDFSLSWLIFAELALAVFSGMVCGAIAVNLRRSE